jgi:hypothetical protein
MADTVSRSTTGQITVSHRIASVYVLYSCVTRQPFFFCLTCTTAHWPCFLWFSDSILLLFLNRWCLQYHQSISSFLNGLSRFSRTCSRTQYKYLNTKPPTEISGYLCNNVILIRMEYSCWCFGECYMSCVYNTFLSLEFHIKQDVCTEISIQMYRTKRRSNDIAAWTVITVTL